MSELYKVHRPKSLDRIVGNRETVATIRSMLEKKRLPHTILFSGPSGCGKTTIARILRRELGCGEMDFVELNCSDFRGIDTVREVIRNMHFAPTGGPCRVWLLDEVHKLSNDAQNGALKMLEDTPSHVYFFLCTTDPGKILPTIRTRCTGMPVKLLTEDETEFLVKRVAKKEGIKLEDNILSELVERAEGSARTSLVLLDKIQNLHKDEQSEALKTRSEEEAVAIDLCRALIKKEPWPKVAKILKGIKGDSEGVRWSVLGYARNVLLSSKDPQAYKILCAFEGNFYDTKEAGLARASFEAIFG